MIWKGIKGIVWFIKIIAGYTQYRADMWEFQCNRYACKVGN